MTSLKSSAQTLDTSTITQEHWIALETTRREAFCHIEQLIEDVRRCRSPEHYRVTQQHLGEHIERVAASIGNANIRISRAKKQLRRSQGTGVDSQESTKAQQEIKAAQWSEPI